MGQRLALLVATYAYEDEGLRGLTAPGHDAEAFAEVLRDPDIAGFDVTILVNEPHHRIGEALGELFHRRRHDDLTLLYFTGHGLKDDEGRLHLAAANTRRDNLLFTSLPAEQIDRAMSGCMSRRQVLILDCCYSGAFPAGRLATKSDADVHTLERFQGHGRTVLTASDATQYSFEGDQVSGSAPQSVFTRHLVQGLRDGSADLDGDGNITLDELYAYVHDKVVDEMPKQRPKKQDDVEGRIVIARNVNWALPAHLQHALRSPIATDRLSAVEQLVHLHQVGNETVRQRTEAELVRLIDDDSRSVSATAAAHLREQAAAQAAPPALTSPVPAPTPVLPRPPVEARPRPVHAPETVLPARLLPAPSLGPQPGTARWSFRTGGHVRSAPAVVDGVVYVGSGDNCLYAVDAATGRQRWRCALGADAIRCAPAVDGDLVYATTARKLHAIDIHTGLLRWEFAVPAGASRTVAVADGFVYLGGGNPLLVLDAAHGTTCWTRGRNGLTSYRWVVLDGQMAILGNSASHVYGFGTLTRNREWSARIGASVSGPSALSDGYLYLGGNNSDLYALNTLDGHREWRFRTGGHIHCAPTVADATVYVGNDEGRQHALHATTASVKWRFTADAAIRTSPAVAGTTAYFGCNDGNVYAVDTATATGTRRERWRFPTGGAVWSSPAVATGVVYVGSDDGRLYAIEAAD